MRNAGLSFVSRPVDAAGGADRHRLHHALSSGRRRSGCRWPTATAASSPTTRRSRALEAEGQVVLRYVERPVADAEGNPNGSRNDIAGICNAAGTVVGIMPHPERVADPRSARPTASAVHAVSRWRSRAVGCPMRGHAIRVTGMRSLPSPVRAAAVAARGPDARSSSPADRGRRAAAWGEPLTVRKAGDYTYLFYTNGCLETCGTYDVVILEKARWSTRSCVARHGAMTAYRPRRRTEAGPRVVGDADGISRQLEPSDRASDRTYR